MAAIHVEMLIKEKFGVVLIFFQSCTHTHTLYCTTLASLIIKSEKFGLKINGSKITIHLL